MRREALVEFGGPDGGDGGRGGDVVFKASDHVNSLLSLYYDPKCIAQDGAPGQGRKMFGKRGKDLIVQVPCGTEVYDAETGLLIADITEHGASVIVAKGGAGGFGNVHFKSSVNQAPVEHTPGGPAEERRLRLELKTIADAGLLGFPNAGKSSILAALSSATPKIASYPFTTLRPIVGTVIYEDYAKVRMADVPGIIEGAAKGVGLGLAFLKHLERSRILIYVIDMAGTDNREPWKDYEILLKEITEYSSELAERPAIVVANKMDEPQSEENLRRFIEETGVDPVKISCASRDGLDNLREVDLFPIAEYEIDTGMLDHIDWLVLPDGTAKRYKSTYIKKTDFIKGFISRGGRIAAWGEGVKHLPKDGKACNSGDDLVRFFEAESQKR
jgi:GTP-binding protein